MAWPGVAEFSSAIQNPNQCFADWELTQGQIAAYEKGGRAGMPVVSSGNFAAVYRITCGSRDYAVRCFTRAVNDQRERYTQLDAFLKDTLPQSFVEFEYLERGIRVAGEWYPVVKMEWVDGTPLDKFVRDNLGTPVVFRNTAARWRGAVSEIRGLDIAHNDLQHGNVMVRGDRSIRMVDYDAMFLPQYNGQTSPENGHQNFQHPLKTSAHYDANIDHFPALVIYVSLLALAADPGLFDKFYNDDNLLFRKLDYSDPTGSECFRALRNNPDDTVRQLIASLEQFCAVPVDRVPRLEELLRLTSNSTPINVSAPDATSATATSNSASTAAPPAPQSSGSAYRDLLQSSQVVAPAYTQTIVTPAAPAPVPAPAVAALTCRGCGQPSPADLIFCENTECIAVLQPGSKFCSGCGTQIASNAIYCLECGRAA